MGVNDGFVGLIGVFDWRPPFWASFGEGFLRKRLFPQKAFFGERLRLPSEEASVRESPFTTGNLFLGTNYLELVRIGRGFGALKGLR